MKGWLTAIKRRDTVGLNLCEVADYLGHNYHAVAGAVRLGLLPKGDTNYRTKDYYSPDLVKRIGIILAKSCK